MKRLGADELRKAYLDFFAERGHRIMRSSPLVPQGDATLLFVNAGMVPFKEIFTGRQARPEPPRATTSQKCVRAGGKHNDLENVGVTARHHTFFEMLGNFSFGDYFKAEACQYAWSFLTEVLEVPKDRLWITIFETDEEAQEIWQNQIGVAPERILRCGAKDNFWAMGDTGPCGPCTEIHWDRRPDEAGDPLADDTRLLEIWNLVFMQYERASDGTLNDLAAKSIDTGMGLERIAAVLAGEASNYHTDLFLPIIEGTAAQAGTSYGRSDSREDIALRVIADHARATTFLVADGVLPSNLGRGYVLRRIVRRAIRHGRSLGLNANFFADACARVIERMVNAFPELGEARELILKVADNEETAFRRTLERGLALLDECIADLEDSAEVPGETAFKLYDTYGFPIDLTRIIAAEQGHPVDEAGFDAAMTAQRERSRGELGVGGVGAVFHELAGRLGSTKFVGYPTAASEGLTGEGNVMSLLLDGAEVSRLDCGAKGRLIVDSTPFYGESGGQVGDSGRITWDGGSAVVSHTGKQAGLHTLSLEVSEGSLVLGTTVQQHVDGAARRQIRANHSATHLLQAALQEVLGDHVKQAGSNVTVDRLRFDFTHFSALTVDERRAVESLINQWVCENAAAETVVMDLEAARAAGAMAMFGEKYDDDVRTVRLGAQSFELCGGTHVDRVGDIGLFRLLTEGALAAGVRRIEAVTGAAAVQALHLEDQRFADAAALLKTSPAQLGDRISGLQARLKESTDALSQLQGQQAAQQAEGLLAQATEVAGMVTIAAQVEGAKPDVLKALAEELRERMGSGVVLLGSAAGPKAFLQVVVSGDLKNRAHAGKLVGVLARHIGGGGGGRPDIAQAGGGKPAGLSDAIAAFPAALRNLVEAAQ
jgi:alanyl-tRNA synthetase